MRRNRPAARCRSHPNRSVWKSRPRTVRCAQWLPLVRSVAGYFDDGEVRCQGLTTDPAWKLSVAYSRSDEREFPGMVRRRQRPICHLSLRPRMKLLARLKENCRGNRFAGRARISGKAANPSAVRTHQSDEKRPILFLGASIGVGLGARELSEIPGDFSQAKPPRRLRQPVPVGFRPKPSSAPSAW